MPNPTTDFLRRSFALGIYRAFITFALLVACFQAFPEHRWAIALAVIAFNQGVAAIIEVHTGLFKLANFVSDGGERKTRHAIVLAAERSGQDWIEGPEFWHEVNRRVEDEIPTPTNKTSAWANISSVILKLGGHLLGDVGLVFLASLFAPGL